MRKLAIKKYSSASDTAVGCCWLCRRGSAAAAAVVVGTESSCGDSSTEGRGVESMPSPELGCVAILKRSSILPLVVVHHLPQTQPNKGVSKEQGDSIRWGDVRGKITQVPLIVCHSAQLSPSSVAR